MAMLDLWEKRSVSVGELCSDLCLDTGTVSPLMKRLAAAGLVERKRGETSDERVVKVRLTEAGSALEEKARAVPGAIAGCIFKSEQEHKTLKPLLDKLVERLESPCSDI
ncbi:MAG: MarR family transcriptional regulator [Spirochaetes bacterium]|nr:MarR family transcriptional regulator [Spirochaetota bacterium]